MKRCMNVLTKEGKEKFNKSFFTTKGYDTLVNYGNTLTEMYFKEKVYPFKIGLVFGLPMFGFASEVKSKDELVGRIKLIMRLTGQESITIKLGNSELTLEFGGQNGNTISS